MTKNTHSRFRYGGNRRRCPQGSRTTAAEIMTTELDTTIEQLNSFVKTRIQALHVLDMQLQISDPEDIETELAAEWLDPTLIGIQAILGDTVYVHDIEYQVRRPVSMPFGLTEGRALYRHKVRQKLFRVCASLSTMVYKLQNNESDTVELELPPPHREDAQQQPFFLPIKKMIDGFFGR